MPTIFAPLTSVQYSPCIGLRLSGKDSYKVLEYFNIKEINHSKAMRAIYSSKKDENIIDDVILIYYKAPNSYTGEDVIEIFFHGNPIIIRCAIDDFSDLGLRFAEPGEFTKRAYLNGKLSISQAESVNAIIHSNSSEGIKLAYNTMYGELDRIFNEIKSEILRELANIEANIDFSEDNLDFDFNSILSSYEKLKNIVNNYKSSKIAVEGVNVSIIGEPNVGKSSIFNAILRIERSIISDEAGTTRDTISENINYKGINFNITDTAGIRETDSIAEKLGIKRSIDVIDKSDLVILVIDKDEIDNEILKKLQYKDFIIVYSKSDINKNKDINLKYDITVSIFSEESILKLKDLIYDKVSKFFNFNSEESYLMAERQYLDCSKALSELEFIKESKILSLDIVTYHLRQSLLLMNTAQGSNISEDTLDLIFSNFCIGK